VHYPSVHHRSTKIQFSIFPNRLLVRPTAGELRSVDRSSAKGSRGQQQLDLLRRVEIVGDDRRPTTVKFGEISSRCLQVWLQRTVASEQRSTDSKSANPKSISNGGRPFFPISGQIQ
ncbi:hypothetical protein ACLOJK_036411, partial [Asimina triloba]